MPETIPDIMYCLFAIFILFTFKRGISLSPTFLFKPSSSLSISHFDLHNKFSQNQVITFWCTGESEVTLEMPSQQHPRLRPKPPLRRQNAIDIASEDSLEGVTLNNPAISIDSASGDPVKKLSVVHADGLISSDDAVSVYLISGDSIVSAAATNEAATGDEDEDDNLHSNALSDISVPNGAVTVSNTVSTNAGTSMDGIGVVHNTTTPVSGGCSLYGTPALSCDSAPGNDATVSLNSVSNISTSNMDTAKLISIKLNECKKASLILVNGVTIPSLDDNSSDIDMIDDLQSHSDLEGTGTGEKP